MPVVNFLACLNLEQNISFLDRHFLKLLSADERSFPFQLKIHQKSGFFAALVGKIGPSTERLNQWGIYIQDHPL